MRITYDIDHRCDGCLEDKKTRKVEGLDIRHRHLEYCLCKKCDTSHGVVSKIMDKNTKKHGFGDPFGLKEGNRRFVIFE